MNNDVIEPSGRFARHPHDNAEIATYITSGALEHKDSVGNGSVIKSGDLQYMSAGDGVFHSELNPSDSEKVEICQICMVPDQKGGQPMYVEKNSGKAGLKMRSKFHSPMMGGKVPPSLDKTPPLDLVSLKRGIPFHFNRIRINQISGFR